ncbi:hypothetical protein vseg_002379 [Gypsophila vaccaria]
MDSVMEWLGSTTDNLKGNTPVSAACRRTYDVTRDVMAKARVMHESLINDQLWGDVTRVAKDLSVHAAIYIVRSYGGGPLIDIVSRSCHEGKTNSRKERLIKELEAKVARLEKELSSSTKLSEHSEIFTPPTVVPSKSQDELAQFCEGVNQIPETVLRNFMMHQFVGTTLFDNLVIPEASQLKENSL